MGAGFAVGYTVWSVVNNVQRRTVEDGVLCMDEHIGGCGYCRWQRATWAELQQHSQNLAKQLPVLPAPALRQLIAIQKVPAKVQSYAYKATKPDNTLRFFHGNHQAKRNSEAKSEGTVLKPSAREH